MQNLERDGFTEQEVKDILHGKTGSRVVDFRYDLLDRFERKKGELKRVRSGEVSMSAFSTIKRTAKFTLEEETVNARKYYTWLDVDNKAWDEIGGSVWRELWTTEEIEVPKVDWLNDRVQPFVVFRTYQGGVIEFPLGIFLLSTPTRKDENGAIVYEVEAYDGLVILEQDKFTERYYIPAGTRYEAAIKDILQSTGIRKINVVVDGEQALKVDKEFSVGESKLEAINNLLQSVNNTPLWVDAYGYYRSEKYLRPDERSVGYTYNDQELSIIVEGVEEELDLFNIPNTWVVAVSNPEEEPMIARAENNNPDSITSIPSRGRRIVDFREIEEISNREALKGYVERIAFEASQVYGRVVFKTPIMPFHEYYDVILLKYKPLGINDRFAETSWTIPLKVGAEMTHEARRVVTII